MKKLISIFSLLAICFTLSSTAYGQMEFSNKSQCAVQVTLTYFNLNCVPVCVSAAQFVPAESEVQLTFPPCIPFADSFAGAGYISLTINTGFGTATVGTGCGNPNTANFLDCTGAFKTLEIFSPVAAAIY